MKLLQHYITILFFLSTTLNIYANHSAALLTSTEADPDSFIDHCVNVIKGDYCESATDLVIVGPDTLLLQRYYSSKNYFTGEHAGGWRIFPQRFLVLGIEASKTSDSFDEKNLERILAFSGERSGGILTYSGKRPRGERIKESLKIDLLTDAIGMVNTYSKDINGQTNHKNNQLNYKDESCEIILGDGSRRIYKKVKMLPSLLLGEELVPYLASQVLNPEYFNLVQETLPSGNHLFFAYDSEGHLSSVEMKNASLNQQLSWIHFTYEPIEQGYVVKIFTSDERTLEYYFTAFDISGDTKAYELTGVKGSHQIPCNYQYRIQDELCFVVKKTISEKQFLEIDYDSYGRVSLLCEPHPHTGISTKKYSFFYNEGYTEVRDAIELKTIYRFDNHFQLIAVEKFDLKNNLFRVDQKIWGKQKENIGQLMAKTISDESRIIRSYCNYLYDRQGNVLEKQIFGNLSGKEEVALALNSDNQLINASNEECYKTSYKYSEEGFNLLLAAGEVTGNQTIYAYKPGTNLCVKELVKETNSIIKRLFRTYDENASCIQVVKDDGCTINQFNNSGVQERQILNIYPKPVLPGLGLPEVIEQKVFDFIKNEELLEKKQVNNFDSQGNLISRDVYDANDQWAYREQKNYNSLGFITLESNSLGQQVSYTYDYYGNRTSANNFQDSKIIQYSYDYRNQLVSVTESAGELSFVTENSYDIKGRKTSVKDHFDNITEYAYDEFGRLCKVKFPPVLDEKEKITYPTFTYAYDIFDNVVCETDALGFLTKKSYTLRGDPSKVFYPDGSTEVLKYHLSGELHRTISRDRIFTDFLYDSQMRIIKKNRFTCGSSAPGMLVDNQCYKYMGSQCVEFGNCNKITQYKFDPFGRPILIKTFAENEKAVDSNSHQEELVYDSLGRLIQKKVWFDEGITDYSIEHLEYDFAGNIITKRVLDSNNEVLFQQGFAYDSNRRCVEEYGFDNGKKISFLRTAYNLLGEPISYIDAMGNETKVDVDYSYYNDLGQKVVKKTITNPQGVQTKIEFDALGRLVRVQKIDRSGQILSNQKIIYDACGNKCYETQDQISEGNKLDAKISRWTYGPMGRLDEEIECDGTLDEKKSAYEYNILGQLVSKTVPGYSNPLTFNYDSMGLLENIKFTDNSLSANQQVFNTYVYNDFGNIIDAKNNLDNSRVKRTFDVFQQMTSETVSMKDHRYTINYNFDRKGRVKTVLLPDGSSILYIYDAMYCREVRRISSQGTVLYSHSYSNYDEIGRLTRETLVEEIGNRNYQFNENHKILNIEFPS